MHADANVMAGLLAQMLFYCIDAVPLASVKPDVLAAWERWRADK